MDPAPRDQADAYSPADQLKDKVALVTGGDSGIGRAVAVMYAREGAHVALVYLDVEQSDAEKTADTIESHGREVLLLPGDVTDPEFCQAAVDEVVEHFGRLDILVNNAACQKHRDELVDISPEQWERTFRTNVYGYFYMTRCAVPYLQPGAAIINTGSITGLEGSEHLVDYASTKGAIHAFTKSLARNLIESGVRVNGVAPGPVWTPLNPAERDDDEIERFGADTPLGRPAQPEEIAPAYVYLASNADSSYVR
jgi:NAD(P)-dependent dehydrogenase (short-subunit alcohol dehydrogenase family)